jgi:hypothetical protein
LRVRRGSAAVLIAALVAATAGCGGDDQSGVQPAPGAAGAEQRVKEFIAAELDGDSETACGYISEDLAAALRRQVGTCEQLVAAQATLAEAGQAKFEDVPIAAATVDDLKLDTELGDDDQTATVTGPKGEQSFELEVIDEQWTITALPGVGT